MSKRSFFPPKKQPPKQKNFFRYFKTFLFFCFYSGIIFSILVFGYLFYLSQNLPNLTNLTNPVYDLPTQVYDRDGDLIQEHYTKRRVLIPINKVPPVMIKALLAIEDSRFYNHIGIDPIRMVKAFIVNVSQMRIAQGASTLTQQTARMFLLDNKKKYERKFKEILLALKIERLFTKDQILELYLNKYYFGHQAYGIEAAAQGYFSKTVSELTLAEAALLAGLPQAPSRWAPTYSMTNAIRRRNQVLQRMAEEAFITEEQKIQAITEPITLKLDSNIDNNETSYYMEHIRRYVLKKYGVDNLYRGGLKVYTTIDLKKQVSAQNALAQGLDDHDKRQGYRGPIKNILQEISKELDLDIFTGEDGWIEENFQRLEDEVKENIETMITTKQTNITDSNQFFIGGRVYGVVKKVEKTSAIVNLGKYLGTLDLETMRWARPADYTKSLNWKNQLKDIKDILQKGDIVILKIIDYQQEAKAFVLNLTQKPEANGSIFAMNPQNGEVLAMCGGYDFLDSEFNRAIQSKRQPGSAFKPVIYSHALDNSFTTASILDDSPLVFSDGWKPINFDKKFKGKMSFRDALVFSKNVPTVRLAVALGIDSIIEYAQQLGITSHIPEDISISLGSASLTMEDMVRTYAIFANGGYLVKPVYIKKIEDRNGNILEETITTEINQVIDEDTAFIMSNMLADVVKRGTGRRAQAINRPSAGKTGTTNDYTDAWYLGYVPQLITGVYVGFDDIRKPLGYYETGSRAAAPIWVEFMKAATEDMPVLPFQQPDNIQMVKINPNSGLKDCDGSPNAIFEYFKENTAPVQCHQQSSSTSQPDEGSNLSIENEDSELEEL